MSKRKISQHQARRIAASHDKRKQRVGQTAATTVLPNQLGPEQSGLLITRYGQTAEVEAEDGQLYHCHLRQNLNDAVAGDNVVWQASDAHHGVITAILPRTTVLTRPTRDHQQKPLAANISCIAIVIAPQPAPTLELIDRYLVAAALLKLQPLLVFNKCDLISEHEALWQELHAIYAELDYPWLVVSAHEANKLTALQPHLRQQTSIFVGQSGVGKSSLIKSLLGEHSIRVGALSETSGLGKHTTTAARLYHLPLGGDLIDSPGVRQFQLWPVTTQELQYGFVELRPYIGQCKFRDCRHQNEPDCAVQLAFAEQKIHPQRLHNFLQLTAHCCA